jgi:hypothetical protein
MHKNEELVAFADNHKHFDIDHDKSDKLPNDTRSHKFNERAWNHCVECFIIIGCNVFLCF